MQLLVDLLSPVKTVTVWPLISHRGNSYNHWSVPKICDYNRWMIGPQSPWPYNRCMISPRTQCLQSLDDRSPNSLPVPDLLTFFFFFFWLHSRPVKRRHIVADFAGGRVCGKKITQQLTLALKWWNHRLQLKAQSKSDSGKIFLKKFQKSNAITDD